MDLKIVSAVARALTVNGSNGYVRVAAGSSFKVGATVNLSSTTPLTNNGLQIQSIAGVPGSTDIALYIIDPSNGQPFNATTYLTAATATVTQPEQRLWYGVGTDEVPPYSPLTDIQMAAVLAAIFPTAVAPASNVTVLNWPASQPVSITSSPLPTNAATQTTLAAVLAALQAPLAAAVTGTFWQATQPVSAASLPLPTGAATQTTLAAVLAALGAPLAVTGTFWQATQPISAAALPLPAGAATEATLLAASAKLPAALGQATMAASLSVAIASDQSAVPVSAAALPLPAGAATSAAQTDGTSKVQVNQTNSFVDAGNSTTVSLAGGGTFIGTALDCLGVVSLSFSASSDVISAVSGIELQWSPDNVYWSTRGISELPATRIGTTQATDLAVRVHDRYFRIKYTNGATPQSWFKLQVLKLNYAVQPDGIGVSQSPKSGDDAILTKAIIAGVDNDGLYRDAQILNHDALGSYNTPGLAVRSILDQYYISAFNEQRVSIPYTLSDIVQKYGRDTRVISSLLNGGGTIADTLHMSGFTLTLPTTSGAYARARTNEWYRYQTGRGQQVILTVVHSNAGVVNQTRNWGYFDDSDGLMYRLVGTTLSLVRRTSTGESGGSLATPYEEIVPQASWNVDKMNGTGQSGVTLDVTKGNIWEVRFQWLGVGTVQWFINGHLVHQMVHPNTLAFPYMRTATLPLSWSVINTGASAAGSLTAICGHVTSQSGQYPPTKSFTSTAAPKSTAAATEIPLLSLRVASLFNTVDNRIPLLPKLVSVSEGNTVASARAYIFVRLNTTLTGAVWAAADASSGAEVDTTATALAGGTILARFSLASLAERDYDLSKLFALGGKTLRRDAYTGVSDILTISIQRNGVSINPSVDGTLLWDEVH
jgi:hypothetical protein